MFHYKKIYCICFTFPFLQTFFRIVLIKNVTAFLCCSHEEWTHAKFGWFFSIQKNGKSEVAFFFEKRCSIKSIVGRDIKLDSSKTMNLKTHS